MTTRGKAGLPLSKCHQATLFIIPTPAVDKVLTSPAFSPHVRGGSGCALGAESLGTMALRDPLSAASAFIGAGAGRLQSVAIVAEPHRNAVEGVATCWNNEAGMA